MASFGTMPREASFSRVKVKFSPVLLERHSVMIAVSGTPARRQRSANFSASGLANRPSVIFPNPPVHTISGASPRKYSAAAWSAPRQSCEPVARIRSALSGRAGHTDKKS